MKWTSILAIYLLFWVLSAFLVMPFHVRTAQEAGGELFALATDARMLARRGDLPIADALALVPPLARDPARARARKPC